MLTSFYTYSISKSILKLFRTHIKAINYKAYTKPFERIESSKNMLKMQNKDIRTFMPRKHFEKEKSCMLFQLVENVGGV
ncbi:hypothetical protein BN1325_620004 [Staphylococcus aureus]|nr:hypothetical protein BN1323_490004 [Staphylococcus aureus]CRI25717.1 hypothetical protein BN1322_540004 [Staphylococcus aureus]CRI25840.1 hypothetical protein SAET23_540003 [Staphylococcus aureus]CRI29967.1 hypothetical protein SAET23_540003 [Staphylococcus aureus]CRI30176.1 hypothetical protein BN1325_620004 [Staphylococcus aureus]